MAKGRPVAPLEPISFSFRVVDGLVTGVANELVSWNRSAEETLGFSRKEVIGKLWHEKLLPSEVREPSLRHVQELLAQGFGQLTLVLQSATADRVCCGLFLINPLDEGRICNLYCTGVTPFVPAHGQSTLRPPDGEAPAAGAGSGGAGGGEGRGEGEGEGGGRGGGGGEDEEEEEEGKEEEHNRKRCKNEEDEEGLREREGVRDSDAELEEKEKKRDGEEGARGGGGPSVDGRPYEEHHCCLPEWPTVMKEIPGCGLSLFAARDLAADETVLEEIPFLTIPEEVTARSKWVDSFESISAILRSPGDEGQEGTILKASLQMLSAAKAFAQAPHGIQRLLEILSCPPLDMEHGLVEVALKVAKLCRARIEECRHQKVVALQKAIMVAECNCFPGGQLFSTICRFNHSCSPNVVFVSSSKKGRIRTLRPIAKGEELTVSYLGEELLFPKDVRQRLLWRSKCFVCACSRCSRPGDSLCDVQCRRCAPSPSRWLVVNKPGVMCRSTPSTTGTSLAVVKTGEVLEAAGEEVMATEEGEWAECFVKYRNKQHQGWTLINGAKLGLGCLLRPLYLDLPTSAESQVSLMAMLPRFAAGGRQSLLSRLDLLGARLVVQDWYSLSDLLQDGESEASLRMPDFLSNPLANSKEVVNRGLECLLAPHANRLTNDGWKCPSCGSEEPCTLAKKLEERLAPVATRVLGMDLTKYNVGFTTPSGKVNIVPDEFIVKALKLADDAGTCLGRRHWIWQLGFLFYVDVELTVIHHCARSINRAPDQAALLLEGLADMWDWLATLGLSYDPACWLHSRATQALAAAASCTDRRANVAKEQLAQRLESSSPPFELLGRRALVPQSWLQMG